MATMRDIRRRIRSVQNTQQITRAMQMVAAARLRKTQGKVLAARPYADALQQVLQRVVAGGAAFEHPLLEIREAQKTALVVFSADRGLCGGYNTNIIRLAETAAHQEERGEVSLIVVGRKAWNYFRRRPVTIYREYLDIGDTPEYSQARELAGELVAMYTTGTFDVVDLAYTQFYSPGRVRPRRRRFLPLAPEEPAAAGGEGEYIYEPSPQELMEVLLPRYVETMVYQVLLEAKASEHASRMVAMEAATKNAGEMIDRLVLTFNKARQAAITKEITEIVGGAEALRG